MSREELFEIFLQEGGNNGEPVLNPDAVSEDEFKLWLQVNSLEVEK